MVCREILRHIETESGDAVTVSELVNLLSAKDGNKLIQIHWEGQNIDIISEDIWEEKDEIIINADPAYRGETGITPLAVNDNIVAHKIRNRNIWIRL
jgi:hypothetical protein